MKEASRILSQKEKTTGKRKKGKKEKEKYDGFGKPDPSLPAGYLQIAEGQASIIAGLKPDPNAAAAAPRLVPKPEFKKYVIYFCAEKYLYLSFPLLCE